MEEAEGYAASLRQMAFWVEEAIEGKSPYPIDLGDIDVDELRAAAGLIERLAGIEPKSIVVRIWEASQALNSDPGIIASFLQCVDHAGLKIVEK